MQTWADGRVSRCALSKKKHRVLRAYRVGVKNLVKECAPVSELRLEGGKHFFPYCITTGTDAGTNGSDQIPRLGTEFQTHLAHTQFDDALDSSTPPRMKGRHDALLAIGQQDRNAIGRLNGKKQARLGRDQAVSLTPQRRRHVARGPVLTRDFLLMSGSGNHKIRVKLAHRNQLRRGITADGRCQEATVSDYEITVVVSSEPKIQLARCALRTIRATDSASAGAESVPEPRQLVPLRNLQQMHAVGSDHGVRRGFRQLLGHGSVHSRGPRDLDSIGTAAAHQS